MECLNSLIVEKTRYLSIDAVEEGMILGKSIYGYNNNLLLAKGSVLTSGCIKIIKSLKIEGVFIESLSDCYMLEETFDEDSKNLVIKEIKSTFKSSINSILDMNELEKLTNIILDLTENILKKDEFMINTIMNLKSYDEYTYIHSLNVAALSLFIGDAINLSRDKLYDLWLSGILHDVGKMFVSKKILNKCSKLTRDEYSIMRKHPVFGYDYLRITCNLSDNIYNGILEHHEKFDGKGYPQNKSGNDISLYGRIICIADVYDALISDRPYREKLLPSEAIEYIMGSSGSQFDPRLVQTFIKKIAPYPIGTCVILSDESIGIIIKNNSNFILRPLVRIIKKGNKYISDYIIDLSNKEFINLTIIDSISLTYTGIDGKVKRLI